MGLLWGDSSLKCLCDVRTPGSDWSFLVTDVIWIECSTNYIIFGVLRLWLGSHSTNEGFWPTQDLSGARADRFAEERHECVTVIVTRLYTDTFCLQRSYSTMYSLSLSRQLKNGFSSQRLFLAVIPTFVRFFSSTDPQLLRKTRIPSKKANRPSAKKRVVKKSIYDSEKMTLVDAINILRVCIIHILCLTFWA